MKISHNAGHEWLNTLRGEIYARFFGRARCHEFYREMVGKCMAN